MFLYDVNERVLYNMSDFYVDFTMHYDIFVHGVSVTIIKLSYMMMSFAPKIS